MFIRFCVNNYNFGRFSLKKVVFPPKKCCQFDIYMIMLEFRMVYYKWLYHLGFVYIQ